MGTVRALLSGNGWGRRCLELKKTLREREETNLSSVDIEKPL